MNIKDIKIKHKILSINSLLIIIISGLLIFLSYQVSKGNEAIQAQKNTLATFSNIQSLSKNFADIKYWILDLAVSFLNEAEENVEIEHQKFTAGLTVVAQFDQALASKLEENAQAYIDVNIEAVDAYLDENRVLGNSLVSDGRAIAENIEADLAQLLSMVQIKTTEISEQVVNTNKFILYISFVLLGLIIAIGVGLSLLLANTIVRPISQALTIANAIADGNLSNRIIVDSKDETGALLSALGKMSDNLANKIASEESIIRNMQILSALDNASTSMLIVDSTDKMTYMNIAAKELFAEINSTLVQHISGFDAEKIIGKKVEDIFHIDTSTNASQQTLKYDDISLLVHITNVKGKSGKIEGKVLEWQNITQKLKEQYDKEVKLKRERENSENNIALMKDVETVLLALSNGDLTSRIDKNHQGEFIALKEYINNMINTLISIVRDVLEASNNVGLGIQEIADGNQQLQARTESQADALDKTTASMENVSSIVKQSSENSEKALHLADVAENKANSGCKITEKVSEAMEEINQSSNKIEKIIEVIDSIAFQTNLLALNAAVEAARAGEQGRGFAVVASEVRNLAQRSASSAKEIKTLIQNSIVKVKDGSKLATDSKQALQEILASISEAHKFNKNMFDSNSAQEQAIEEINVSIMDMVGITKDNEVLVDKVNQSGKEMQTQTKILTDKLGFFQIGNK